MNWAVYLITNKINGKGYVGICNERVKSIFDRFNDHKELAKSGGRYTTHGRKFPIYAAISKYGEENFSIKYLEVGLDLYDAQEKETEYINEYDTLVKNGYNLTEGGEEPDWDPDDWEYDNF